MAGLREMEEREVIKWKIKRANFYVDKFCIVEANMDTALIYVQIMNMLPKT